MSCIFVFSSLMGHNTSLQFFPLLYDLHFEGVQCTAEFFWQYLLEGAKGILEVILSSHAGDFSKPLC